MVLDLGLSDMTGFRLIEEIKKCKLKLRGLARDRLHGQRADQGEETQLRRLAESVIVKGVQSPERLLDETALFLHRAAEKMPALQRRMVEEAPPARSRPSPVSACSSLTTTFATSSR